MKEWNWLRMMLNLTLKLSSWRRNLSWRRLRLPRRSLWMRRRSRRVRKVRRELKGCKELMEMPMLMIFLLMERRRRLEENLRRSRKLLLTSWGLKERFMDSLRVLKLVKYITTGARIILNNIGSTETERWEKMKISLCSRRSGRRTRPGLSQIWREELSQPK